MDMQMPLSPEADGFIPPWAEWDFNEWETCTDTDLHHGVRMSDIFLLYHLQNNLRSTTVL